MEDLKQIKIASYIAVALLILNTLLLISYNKGSEKKVDTTGSANEEIEYDTSMFTQIDAAEFIDSFKAKELSAIYIGRADCGYCVQFLPTLQQSIVDYDYELLYLDLNDTNAEDGEKIRNLDEFFVSDFGTTPMVVFVKDGKVVKNVLGMVDYESYQESLTGAGIAQR